PYSSSQYADSILTTGKVVAYGPIEANGPVSAGGLVLPNANQIVRNKVRNATFRVNQREAVSGTSLGVDQYFLDGWKSISSSNPVTWVGGADNSGRILTIPSSKAIRQTIERADIPAGTYVLSIIGTSQG